jgi:hypothetical protein
VARIIPPTSTEGRRLIKKLLATHQRRFEQGDDTALLLAAELIILFAPLAPQWLKDAFDERFVAWRSHKVRSLDAAFKVEREHKHSADQRLREELRVWIVGAVVHRGKPRKAVFKSIAKELGRSPGWVDTLFYEPASRPLRKLFRDPLIKPS